MTYANLDRRSRWVSLGIICLGILMILVDATIVNVALPTIRSELGFTETSLVWVVNVYMLTFGGFLLLAGRLGDLYGPRDLFLIGITVFTLASLACGLAESRGMLIFARGVQGLGGAIVASVSLALLMSMFEEGVERAKALGVYSFVCAAGGAVGLCFGGILTDMFNWHWIFLVNVPIGVVVCALCFRVLPAIRTSQKDSRLDVWGAVTVTTSMMALIYALVGANGEGGGSTWTRELLMGAASLFVAFLIIESYSSRPLVPLRIFKIRNLTVANLIFVLWSACMGSWFYLTALYMQLVLGYSPIQIATAFLPLSILVGGFSLGLSARIVTRFGIRGPMTVGLVLRAAGLALFARVPVDGRLLVDILPAMILLGVGAGIGSNPVLLAAMRDVPRAENGLASGIINAGAQIGGAIGLALLAGVAASRTGDLLAAGVATRVALTSGYRVAFFCASLCAVIALTGAFFMGTDRPRRRGIAEEGSNSNSPNTSSLSNSSDEVKAL